MSNDRTNNDGSHPPKSRDQRHVDQSASQPRVPSAAELGKRLRRLRKEVGYSLGQVATLCHVSASDVETFERDGTASAASLLKLIAGFSWSCKLDEAFELARLATVEEMLAYQQASS